MANKKYKQRYVTTIPLEHDVFFYVKKNLPKGVEVADEINKFLLETKERLEKEKNLNSPNYSAVQNCDDGNNNIQTNLDKYFPYYLQDWRTFKRIISDELNNEERKKLTEKWGHNFSILEMVNKEKTGTKVFPFYKK